ncbi:MAG: flagellar basal-body rod protein FlgF [Acidobacteriales bacterium]|nr:flagellar basal-body rod protein FlgF [Terriglobales bacterium]
MDRLTISAASGLRARMESMEMLANNLANASASGYKLDREFYSLYLAPEADGTISQLPLIDRQWTDFSQGTLTPTGNQLDLALSGSGFFAVDGPNGTLYTRNGAFQLSASGRLETKEGYAVRAAGGGIITVDPTRSVEISPDGAVWQQGVEMGRIQLADVSQPSALGKQSGLYFQLDPGAGVNVGTSSAQVQQGKLENSNVGSAEAAVRMISVMRQFEMLQRAVTLGAEMNRRGVEEVAKLS